MILYYVEWFVFQWMHCSVLNPLWQGMLATIHSFFIRTLAERKWHCFVVRSTTSGENGGEHLKCSINVVFVVLTSNYYLSRIFFPVLTNFFMSWLLMHGPLDHLDRLETAGSSQCTLDTEDSREFLSCRRLALVSEGRALIRTGNSS